MAVTCFCSPQNQILVQKKTIPLLKPATKILMLKQYCCHVPLQKASKLLVRSSLKDKVFENRSEGILCYRDDSTGEIVCEGLDEGPRFHPTTHPRDAEIIALLQQRLKMMVNGDGFNNAVQEDCNLNGFSKFF